MSNWHEHLEKEDELYTEFDNLGDITRTLYVVKSLEGRLRKDKHLIYGTLLPHNEEEALIIRMKPSKLEEGNIEYETLLHAINIDKNNILVLSNYSSLDFAIKDYCLELNNKYSLGLVFRGQSQSSSNHHLP